MLGITEVTSRTHFLIRLPRWQHLHFLPTDGWLAGFGLAAAIGAAYFLIARLSLGLVIKADGVAVFWPAAGVTSGVLIALGPRVRWFVALGAVIGTFPADLLGDRNVWASSVFALANAAESLITAGLIQHYFGDRFSLNRVRNVFGLFAAAAVAATASGIIGTIGYRLFHSPAAPVLTTWLHWFASDTLGILAVAPVLIGLAAAVRETPSRSKLVESVLVLALLSSMTAVIVTLPEKPWQTVVPAALLFPMLLWLAARAGPVFTAVGAFIVSFTIVWTTIFEMGHFGDLSLPFSDRILQAQAVISTVVFGSLILAALFSERRDSEERLAHSVILLRRERDNKLANAQAIAATIAHELKQPLTGIVASSDAAQRLLRTDPPNLEKVQVVLEKIARAGCHAGEMLDGLRDLFGRRTHEAKVLSVNEIVQETLNSLKDEFAKYGVVVHADLTSDLPKARGYRSQLEEVVTNLCTNAIEAMSSVAGRSRLLCVQTKLRDQETILVKVDDSGPGIDADELTSVFNTFFTTKRNGMGLGLAISRMIVEQHGGQLTASSNRMCGASFQIMLPAVATATA